MTITSKRPLDLSDPADDEDEALFLELLTECSQAEWSLATFLAVLVDNGLERFAPRLQIAKFHGRTYHGLTLN